MITPTYMEAIGEGWPNVQAAGLGDGSVYEQIIWRGGDPLPTKADIDVWIAAKIKDAVWRLIQAERDRRKAGGVLVGTYWFHTDDASRIQQLGLLMMGANMPTNIMWKTMTGAFVQMSPTLAGQIFAASAQSDVNIFTIAEQLKVTMLASSNPALFDYLNNAISWPAIYS